MLDVVKARTYSVPIDLCFQTLHDLLPDMGVIIQANDEQRCTLYAEYHSKAATGDDGPVVAIKGVCTPIDSNTSMVKLSYLDSEQPDTITAPVIEAKLIAILNALNNCLALVAASTAEQGRFGIVAPRSSPMITAAAPGQTTASPFAEWAALDYARSSLQAGVPRHEIQSNLMGRGYDLTAASHIVLTAVDALDTRKDAAQGMMMKGALWCIGGLIVTLGTYTLAAPGGTYIVAWGAMLFGGIQFVRGLVQYVNS
jgi:hypothetical protein